MQYEVKLLRRYYKLACITVEADSESEAADAALESDELEDLFAASDLIDSDNDYDDVLTIEAVKSDN